MILSARVSTFGQDLLRRHGERVHKIALDAGFTCPNRDGTKGRGGCSFCNNVSFSPDADTRLDLSAQIAKARRAIARRTRAKKFIVYFQAYTNTYAKIEALEALYREALKEPDMVGISVGTRPDCVSGEVLDLLDRFRAQGLEDWLEVANKLSASGKQVVLSTLALVESESDLKTLRRQAENDSYMVEANDMGAVRLMSGKRFVAGPHINTYNPETLALLAELGAQRWVIPVEMSRQMLTGMLAGKPQGMETEVFAYGRLPLAFSARCFTARHYNLPKDDCQFRCLDHGCGLTLNTREGQPFLALNGIQTQSSRVYNLVGELQDMQQVGVNVVRVSPQPFHTEKILALFRQGLDGSLSGLEAVQQMAGLMPDEECDGYWHGRSGIEQVGIVGQTGFDRSISSTL